MLKFLKKKQSKEKIQVKNAEYYLSLFAHREMIERANSGNTLDYCDAMDYLITDIENYEVENQKLKIQIQSLCLQNNILSETQELNTFGFFIKFNKYLIKEIYIIKKFISFYHILLTILYNIYNETAIYYYITKIVIIEDIKILYNIYNEIVIYYYLTKLVIIEDIQYKKEFIKYYLFGPPPPEPRKRLRTLLT